MIYDGRKLKVVTEPAEILHQTARKVTKEEILASETQGLISEIRELLKDNCNGVGMSAVQVGVPVALSVIETKPTPKRPELKRESRVCFNGEIVKEFGEKIPMWEGCCSVLGEDGQPVYAKVPRFKKVRVRYLNEKAEEIEETVEGFLAHVMQHETDHNMGVLFTDLVDRANIISYDEFHGESVS